MGAAIPAPVLVTQLLKNKINMETRGILVSAGASKKDSAGASKKDKLRNIMAKDKETKTWEEGYLYAYWTKDKVEIDFLLELQDIDVAFVFLGGLEVVPSDFVARMMEKYWIDYWRKQNERKGNGGASYHFSNDFDGTVTRGLFEMILRQKHLRGHKTVDEVLEAVRLGEKLDIRWPDEGMRFIDQYIKTIHPAPVQQPTHTPTPAPALPHQPWSKGQSASIYLVAPTLTVEAGNGKVYNYKHCLLMIREEPTRRYPSGAWYVPGGIRDQTDNTFFEAARREFREEVGAGLSDLGKGDPNGIEWTKSLMDHKVHGGGGQHEDWLVKVTVDGMEVEKKFFDSCPGFDQWLLNDKMNLRSDDGDDKRGKNARRTRSGAVVMAFPDTIGYLFVPVEMLFDAISKNTHVSIGEHKLVLRYPRFIGEGLQRLQDMGILKP